MSPIAKDTFGHTLFTNIFHSYCLNHVLYITFKQMPKLFHVSTFMYTKTRYIVRLINWYNLFPGSTLVYPVCLHEKEPMYPNININKYRVLISVSYDQSALLSLCLCECSDHAQTHEEESICDTWHMMIWWIRPCKVQNWMRDKVWRVCSITAGLLLRNQSIH